ncbi:MAG: hypothetical protein F6J87_18390 [Spirulina sp. SIO3F2]|nr:hypothetical protein [Spirulina sp. SIO3F2]
MQGVQFLVNSANERISALIDLKIHAEFWAALQAETANSSLIFLTNEHGQKVALVLDLTDEEDQELWEDFCDGVAIATVAHEPRIAWATAKADLDSIATRV